MLHSSCFFENCTRNGNGGAIFFNCSGSIVQRRFCSLSTSTSLLIIGLFSYTILDKQSSNQNIVDECSVCLCYSTKAVSPIAVENGNISLSNSNISKNTASQTSAFATLGAYETGIINYSTFEDNNATKRYCLGHSSANYHYYCCNIIGNSHALKMYGTFYASEAYLEIENCIIRGNSKDCPLFTIDGECKVINCNVDDSTLLDDPDLDCESIFSDDNYSTLSHILISKCKFALSLAKKSLKNEETSDISSYFVISFLFCLAHKLFII